MPIPPNAYLSPTAAAMPLPGRRAVVVLLLSLLTGTFGLVLGGPWALPGALVAVPGCLCAYALQFRALWYADPPAHAHDCRYRSRRQGRPGR